MRNKQTKVNPVGMGPAPCYLVVSSFDDGDRCWDDVSIEATSETAISKSNSLKRDRDCIDATVYCAVEIPDTPTVKVDELAQRFRVITNGLRFRVERLEWRNHLWRRKQKWIPLCHYDPFGYLKYPVEFKTREEAQERIDHDVRELQAELHGWHLDTSNERR